MDMNEREAEVLKLLQSSIFDFIKSTAISLLSRLGLIGASVAAQVTTLVVLVVLGCNLFLFINLAIGFAFGEWFGSFALGFLTLSGLYLGGILLYLLLRQGIERSIKSGIASGVLDAGVTIGEQLEKALPTSGTLLSDLSVSRPTKYGTLELRAKLYELRARESLTYTAEYATYLKDNYRNVALNYAEVKAKHSGGVVAVLAPALRFFRNKSDENRQNTPAEKKPSVHYTGAENWLDRTVDRLVPYVPYIKRSWGILSPVISVFLVTKVQGVFASLLGISKTKRWKKRR